MLSSEGQREDHQGQGIHKPENIGYSTWRERERERGKRERERERERISVHMYYCT